LPIRPAERQAIAGVKETKQLHDKPGDTVKPDGMGLVDEALYPPVMGIGFGFAGKCLGELGQVNGFLEKITRPPSQQDNPSVPCSSESVGLA